MALLFQIEGATLLDHGVWKARLSPSEIRLLEPATKSVGDFTVLLLIDEPRIDPESHLLSFDPSKARVLNAGSSGTAILLGNPAKPLISSSDPTGESGGVGSGDAKFLGALPSQLQELGMSLLAAVRKKYPGDLVFYEASGKYVEAPDNFWTIRPQPRDRSFRITVRGRPESFVNLGTLQIKPDMTGYSSFKIEKSGQIEELLQLFGQIHRK